MESANQQWQQASATFHTTFQALDEAYQRSMVSFATQNIAEKDEERDQWGGIEQRQTLYPFRRTQHHALDER